MTPHRQILAIPALVCIGTAVFFFLIAPTAAAAGGFVEGDCTCSLSGVSATTRSAGSTELQCTWTKSGGSAKYPAQLMTVVKKVASKSTALSEMQATNNFNRQSISGQRKNTGFSCVEEYYGDTKSSFVCGDTTSMGSRAIIYRDTYAIGISGAGFTSGQDLKSYLDKLEPCMKAAADSHAGRQSGTSIPVKTTTIKKPTTTVKPGPAIDGADLVSDAIGSAENAVQGGLTPLGGELLNLVNNGIGDLTGDKPVPPGVEEALEEANVDCDEKDQETRDKCFRDAAIRSGNPLICLKMHAPVSEIRDCYYDIAKQATNPEVCGQMTGSILAYWQDFCYRILYNHAKDPSLCNSLISQRRDECFAALAQNNKNLDLCDSITNDLDQRSCLRCVILETRDDNLCETLDTEEAIRYCHEDIRLGYCCSFSSRTLNELLFNAKEKTTGCSTG